MQLNEKKSVETHSNCHSLCLDTCSYMHEWTDARSLACALMFHSTKCNRSCFSTCLIYGLLATNRKTLKCNIISSYVHVCYYDIAIESERELTAHIQIIKETFELTISKWNTHKRISTNRLPEEN